MNKGFTLLELLIVIAIIGLLASAVLVTYPLVTGKARLANALQWAGSMNHLLGANAVGIWTFDNISGTTVYDDSGMGNNGTIVGATQVDDGVIGKAMSFDGDDYVDIGDPTDGSLDFGTGVFTIAAWVKTPPTVWPSPVYRGIFSKADRGYNPTGGYSFELGLTAAAKRFSLTLQGKNSDTMGISLIPAEFNTWYHLVGTYDGFDTRLYQNGILRKTYSYSAGNLDNIYNAYIGRTTDNRYLDDGLIDDVRIFKEAFTQAQVKQLYAEGLDEHQNLIVQP